MISAVDTNILLDIIIPNQPFLNNSLQKLESAAEIGTTIICEIVYAELASQFQNRHELTAFLNDTHIEIVYNTEESLFLASRLWLLYRKSRSKRRYCSECGRQIKIFCPQCGLPLDRPRRMLNDFIIGSHAQSFADGFLTRDSGFYRKYFSDLEIQ